MLQDFFSPVSPAGSIFIGVLSGVLTAFFLAFLSEVFRKIFLPWYQDLVFSGANVEGDWHGQRIDGSAKYNFNISLQQTGSRLKGEFIAVDEFPDRTTTKKFSLSGYVRGNIVCLIYRSPTTKVWGGGTFVFMLFEGGTQLGGAMSYVRTKSGTIEAKDDLKLHRVD